MSQSSDRAEGGDGGTTGSTGTGGGSGSGSGPSSSSGSKKKSSKWDGLIPVVEEQARDKWRLFLLITGIIQLVGSVALLIGVRVLMFMGNCGSPVMFELPLKFDDFKATGELCYLGYYLLGFSTTALSVLLAQGILAIVNSRWMHYYILLVGMFFFSLCSLTLLVIVIIMLATGFPFAPYTLPTILLTALNIVSLVFAGFLKPYYKKMREELKAREADEETNEQEQPLTEHAADAGDPPHHGETDNAAGDTTTTGSTAQS